MEPQEVEALAVSRFEVHDPGLGWRDGQVEPVEFLVQHGECLFCLGFVTADDYQIVGVADEPPQPSVVCLPGPVATTVNNGHSSPPVSPRKSGLTWGHVF